MTDESYAGQDEQNEGPISAQPWLDKIKEYKTAFQKWEDQRDRLDKLYSKDERADSADREYSIFWANIEVLRPATYARPPVPVVAARFKDGNVLARSASEVLERTLVVSFEQGDLDGAMQDVRDEFLRYGRGTAWCRLSEKYDGTPCLEYDWITANDFAHGKAKTWRRVPWVARREWLTREKGAARFDEAMEESGIGSFADIPLRKQDENAVNPDKGDTAPVWEIWDRESRCVYWVAEDFKHVIEKRPAFLDLKNFFPCPKPAYGTLVPKTLRPVPEIRQYKDQIEEINEYTARIAALSESLRMKGFYPAGSGDISEAIEAAMKSMDNRALLVPISSVAAFGGGSFKDMVVWWPVGEVIALVRELVELRRVVIEDVYQITGISDIVRGQTDPRETKGAQELKSQWGSIRIQERQKELARFARDMTRIAGEVIAENFPPEVVREMSQLQLPSAQDKQQAQQAAQLAQQMQRPIPEEAQAVLEKPSFEEVIAFLQKDRTRGFVIEIETDSTIQPDEDAEKQRRIEFVTAVGGLFQQAAPIVMQAPVLGGFVSEVLKFAAAGFRAGRPLEGEIEKLSQQLAHMAKQAAQAPEKPDPAQMQAEQEMQQSRAEHEQKMAQGALTMRFEQARHEMELQQGQQKFDQDMANAKAKSDEQIRAVKEKARARPASAGGTNAPAQPDMSEITESMEQVGSLVAQAVNVLAQSSQQLAMAAQTMAQAASAPKQVVRNPQTGQVERVEPVSVQ